MASKGRISALACGVTEEQVAGFLSKESKKDPGVLDRFEDAKKRAATDYRPRMLAIFEDACEDFFEECLPEADFSKISAMAREFESKGNFAEAAAVWRDLSEVVCDEIGFYAGCDQDYYSDLFREAISAMASSSRRSPDPERRSSIAYLTRRCLDKPLVKTPFRKDEWKGTLADEAQLAETYMTALRTACASKADLEYWLSLTGGRSPAKLLMRARVMRRLRDPALGKFLTTHRKRSPGLYAEYVGYLRRSGADGARAARAGARLFPNSADLEALARRLGRLGTRSGRKRRRRSPGR